MPLTQKQKLFVESYLANPNATKAAIAAGYSERTARQQGNRLLTTMATIYAIRDADGVFYVGSTIKQADERFNQHLSDVRRGKHVNSRFAERVAASGSVRCSVIILDTIEESRRFECEYEWIAKLQKQGVRLTNVIKSANQQEYLLNAKRREFMKFVRVLVMFQINGRARIAEGAPKADLIAELVESTARDLQNIFRDNSGDYIERYGDELYCEGLRHVTSEGVLPLIGIRTALCTA